MPNSVKRVFLPLAEIGAAMVLPVMLGILSIADLAGTTKATTSRRRMAMVSPLVGITASLRTIPRSVE